MTLGGGSDKATKSQTFMNLLKVGIGPGCLALPFAFAKAGLVPATVLLCVMSALVYRNTLLAVKIKNKVKRQHPNELISSYGDVTNHVIGPKWGEFVNCVLISMQLGICTVYFRFIPTNLHATIHSIPEHEWLQATIPCLVMLTWIKHMKQLAPFATFANIATLITVMTVVGFAASVMYDTGHPADTVVSGVLEGAPVFFGIAIYSFEGSGAVLSIHESMQDPSDFHSALRQAGIVVFSCFMLTGLVCYVSFGSIANGSITAELGHRTHSQVLGFLNLLIAVAVALTYPMQAYAAIEVMERKLGIRDGQPGTKPDPENAKAAGYSSSLSIFRNTRFQQIVFRTVVVLATALAASSVHNLGLIASLFGSVNGSIIALILPPVLELNSNASMTWHERLLNWFTVLFGTIGGISGTCVVISDIIHQRPIVHG